MPLSITVFTTNSCASCKMIKMWLDRKGLDYNEVNVELHPEHRSLAQKLSGSMAVPVTVVTRQDKSQGVVVGYNPSLLSSALS